MVMHLRILVAATLPPYVFSKGDDRYWGNWLKLAEMLRLDVQTAAQVDFFAALETDARGLEPFRPLLERLNGLDGSYTSWASDPGGTEFTSDNRLAGICLGRNIIARTAEGRGYDWILYLDADMRPPSNAISKLLELDYPMCGGHVPTYCLSGPWAYRYPPEWDVQIHMNTAGFLLVHRDVFTKLTWRTDVARGMTDDPCYHADADALGYPTFVRHDVVGRHFPESLPPMEFRGHDRTRYAR